MADPKPDLPPKAERQLSNLALLWSLAKRYPGRLAAALAALLVAASATLAIPAGFGQVVDHGFNARGGGIARHFINLLGIVVVLGIATATRFYFVSWLGERVVADLRRRVHAHLLGLDPAYFEENRPAEIASRLTSDTAIIEQLVSSSASLALRNLVTGTGGVAYMFYISPKLTGLMLLVIPAVIAPIVLLGRRVRTLSRSSQDRVADVGTVVSETLGAIKIVQGFTQEPREAARFGGTVERAFGVARKRIGIRAVMTAVVTVLVFGAITLVMWEAAADVAAGRMTGGAITAFIATAAVVAGAFGTLTEVYGDFLRGAGASGRMREILAARAEVSVPAWPVALPMPARGRVAFEGVTFGYPTRPDTQAVRELSLIIEPGETVAVVGPSGAGKSTLFQLVQRFYDPQAGRVTMDGVDLRDADPADVRRRISVVPQDTVVFAASALDNIRYGAPDASEAEVWAAAEAANAGEFLRALPDRLDTYLGEGGARLSGGQRQRIAIARAVLRDAPVLLLDEATSALDAESERLVQTALERLMRGRTTLVIAHRLATVRDAERIVVMSEGRIVAEGTHGALIAEDGLYARLARLQFDEAA